MSQTFRKIIAEMRERRAVFIEWQVRKCLEQWVSELEPTMIMANGEFLGLGLAGLPEGSIVEVVVEAPGAGLANKLAYSLDGIERAMGNRPTPIYT